jgi:hypothetical protein
MRQKNARVTLSLKVGEDKASEVVDLLRDAGYGDVTISKGKVADDAKPEVSEERVRWFIGHHYGGDRNKLNAEIATALGWNKPEKQIQQHAMDRRAVASGCISMTNVDVTADHVLALSVISELLEKVRPAPVMVLH